MTGYGWVDYIPTVNIGDTIGVQIEIVSTGDPAYFRAVWTLIKPDNTTEESAVDFVSGYGQLYAQLGHTSTQQGSYTANAFIYGKAK